MSDIEAVKSRLDIVDVIGDYVPLQRAGHSYKGPCPFHKEKTPSFIVTPSLQIFKCFGCGEGGDVLSFIQKIERLDFGDALKFAADKAGYQLTSSYDHKDEKVKAEEKKILEANQLATKYWNYLLKTHPAGKPGRDYLAKRGVAPKEIDTFMLGYAPNGTNLIPFLLKKGFGQQDLIRWGFAVERKGQLTDKFRDRFIMPIWNTKGDIVGFSGRVVTPNDYAPKYLNSPETLVYKKGEILMGLYQAAEAARANKTIILQEGNVDLLTSHKAGVANIVATGGTALTEAQIKLLKRYADLVIFAFDNDQAGIKALIKGVELAEKLNLAHKAADLGEFKDPDELIKADPKLWQEKVTNPVNTVEHLFQIFQRDLDLGAPDDKSVYVKRLAPVLYSMQDKVQQTHFIKQLALAVGATEANIRQSMSRMLGAKSDTEVLDVEEKAAAKTTKAVIPNRREIYLLALLIQLPNIQDLEISGEIFTDVNTREIFNKLMQVGNKAHDFANLSAELSDGGAETLLQVLSTEIEHPEAIEQEVWSIYKSVYANYLRSQILDLRRNLQNYPDDSAQLQRLQHLTRELAQLT